jgi:hypothetical protein
MLESQHSTSQVKITSAMIQPGTNRLDMVGSRARCLKIYQSRMLVVSALSRIIGVLAAARRISMPEGIVNHLE